MDNLSIKEILMYEDVNSHLQDLLSKKELQSKDSSSKAFLVHEEGGKDIDNRKQKI